MKERGGGVEGKGDEKRETERGGSKEEGWRVEEGEGMK